jgi:hypothetical protein
MCDYSLEMYGSKPAQEGERYVLTRFPSGSMGLASAGDRSCPVCVQYDTRLLLEGVPVALQAAFGAGASEEVTFTRLEHGAYRDGIRFANGRKVSLQQLSPGISVSVISLLENQVAARRIAELVG